MYIKTYMFIYSTLRRWGYGFKQIFIVLGDTLFTSDYSLEKNANPDLSSGLILRIYLLMTAISHQKFTETDYL